jgi:hypothetical protein
VSEALDNTSASIPQRKGPPRPLWLVRTALLLVLSPVLMLTNGPVAAAAAESPDGSLAHRVTTQHSAGQDWRRESAAALAALPPVILGRTLSGKLGGAVITGTARLAGTIELSGDTTIVARELVLAERTVTVRANGHALRVPRRQRCVLG